MTELEKLDRGIYELTQFIRATQSEQNAPDYVAVKNPPQSPTECG